MSTRATIKHQRDPTTGNGYHLFRDMADQDDEPPVYLELRGVDFEAAIAGDDGQVLVTIPWVWAVALGLLRDEGQQTPTPPDISYADWIEAKLLQVRGYHMEKPIRTRLRAVGDNAQQRHQLPQPPRLSDVCQLSEANLLEVYDFGFKSLAALKALLAEDGLHLGMGR